MNDALIGLGFLLCLIIGMLFGFFLGSRELGGVIGLGSGLLLILFFRKRNMRE